MRYEKRDSLNTIKMIKPQFPRTKRTQNQKKQFFDKNSMLYRFTYQKGQHSSAHRTKPAPHVGVNHKNRDRRLPDAPLVYLAHRKKDSNFINVRFRFEWLSDV